MLNEAPAAESEDARVGAGDVPGVPDAAVRAALIRGLDVPRPEGAATLAGRMFLARGAAGVTDGRNAVDAALSFPRVTGALVVHVHAGRAADRGVWFAVDDQVLSPAEFHERLAAVGGRPAGQPVILVACRER